MFRILLLILLAIGWPGETGRSVGAEEPKSNPQIERQRQIRQLMNRIKKAPQPAVKSQAWKKIRDLGISRSHVERALQLDRGLTDPDPDVRRRASELLARLRFPTRVVAAQNLRNLVAGEYDPDLKWIHAVTLSSILPQEGSAVDVLLQNPDDPILREALNLRSQEPGDVLTMETVDQMMRRLNTPILARLDWIADEPPNAQLIYPRSTYPSYNVTTPPPPAKIPAHPLIAARRFEKILELMDRGSEDARELFHLYGDEFPPEMVAKKYVPAAFGKDYAKRKYAIDILKDAGSDARKVAALAATMQDPHSYRFSIEKQSDTIAGLTFPGACFEELLHFVFLRNDYELRLIVLSAMGDRENMRKQFLEKLRLLLNDSDTDIEAGRVFKRLTLQKKISQAWLKEVLLTEQDPLLLRHVAFALREDPYPGKFQKKLFERIGTKNSADVNLIFIDGLLKHSQPDSEAHKKLLQLKTAMQKLRIAQTDRQLTEDLRWMIEQSRKTKQQMRKESIEQLKKLGLLD